MNCGCFCKDDDVNSVRDKRNTPENTFCSCNSIINLRVFLFLLIALCLLVILNLLTTNAHLSTIVKVSSNIRSSMHQFIQDESRIIKSLYKTTNVPQTTPSQPEVTTPRNNNTSKKTKAKPSVRPDTCASCFEHNFNYIIDNPTICDTEGKANVDIIILIFTTHARKKNRDAIRETWASAAKNNTANVRYAFLLGYTKNEELQSAVEGENSVHHDILQEDFVDAYMNLTYKTMMAFKWAITKCDHAKFFMKTDDDMYVNTRALLSVTNGSKAQLQKSIGGACHKSAGPIRDRKSKWYASFESYPSKAYPGFCSGTGYVTSINMAKKVFEISRNVPFFHLEDVFVSLCVRKLGLSLLPIRGFHADQVRPHTCKYKNNVVVTSHYMSPELLRKVWKLVC